MRLRIGSGLCTALAAAMLVSGCGGGGADVPEAVTALMAKEFAADGQVHVQSREKIVIKPETAVCYIGGYFPNSTELFKALGQSASTQSGSRMRPAREERCKSERDAVLSYGTQTPNRSGKPYKLVLAVWQGDVAKGGAYWVGGVERLEKGPRPDIFNPYGTESLPLELEADLELLSQNFINSIGGAQ